MKNLTIALVFLAAARTAHAFCGFYVAGGDQQMFNDATQVVLMRSGTRTVLAMQNNYKGPPQDFAMVIPVPAVLHEGDVKTLPKEIFDHVEQMGAPRLVEYWEQDPCRPEYEDKRKFGAMRPPSPSAQASAGKAEDLGVTIEAQFVVGEYQIVILSAKDSTGLDTWLHQQKYNIPPGAEPLLRPYVEGGSKFFVAKVDPQKVKFDNGRAALSPLRFHYDTERFELPIRLGLANSSGTQDLIVNILAPHQRYEVANYPNVTIPTNLNVKESVKDKFGAFYTALYDRTVEKHPGAVVTEYAWQATTCDPCPGPALGPSDFITLGADVLDPKQQAEDKSSSRYYGYGYDFVLTRLHARYGKDIKDDLVFKAAEGIVGGREAVIDTQTGKLEEGAKPSPVNNFQGRYAIRHEWTGPVRCESPQRHRWGGPPQEIVQRPDFQPTGIKPALGLAFAPRGEIQLPLVVRQNIPEIDVQMAAGTTPVESATTPSGTPVTPKAKSGCGCESSDAPGGLLLGLVALFTFRRRRS